MHINVGLRSGQADDLTSKFGATGNMDTFNQDNTGNGVWNLEQTRSHSAANEITSISQEAGQPQWVDPDHDAAGNMVVMPKPDDLTEPMFATYDAWNRMVSASQSSADSIGSYDFDGMGRRIRKRTYVGGHLTETRDYYYAAGVQSVEERVDGGDLPAVQYVLPNPYRWPAVRSQRGS